MLFIAHTYLIGQSQKKLEALARAGVRVGLLTPSNWVDRSALFHGKKIALERPFRHIEYYAAPVIRPGHIASFLFLPGAIARTILAFKPDVVQVEQEVYSFAAAQAALAAKVQRKKVVVFGWENLDRPLPLIQRICRRITLSLADVVICGNTAGSSLVRKWGYKRRVEVMPQLGVDPDEFAPSMTRRSGPLRIGFTGRMVHQKGGDVLLRAFRLLMHRGLDAELLFLGTGPQKEAWQSLAAELGIAERIQWLGSVPHVQVPEMMAQMDVLVLPSRSAPDWQEQFGLVLAQAMMRGLPVIGSTCGAIPEVIGREDVIFPEGNEVALARILERILVDEGWRRELSQYGRERALCCYSFQALAEKLIQVYLHTGLGCPSRTISS
uniref:Glycosyl transferase family 1 n=1 Tax=uncultured Chloroflexota bacterium TaxID=166587 RepID=H5SBC7_9CHLR|nr:glycosyl transferase family 1 [uncultured Chloroflexota bacterium]